MGDVLSDAFWFTLVVLSGLVLAGYTWFGWVYQRAKREREARQAERLVGRGKDRYQREADDV